MNGLLKLSNQFSESIYESINIFMANPSAITIINFENIPTNVLFMADSRIEDGKVLAVIDDKLKRTLYECFESNPSMFFKGRKIN